jgi:hypothetical protein
MFRQVIDLVSLTLKDNKKTCESGSTCNTSSQHELHLRVAPYYIIDMVMEGMHHVQDEFSNAFGGATVGHDVRPMSSEAQYLGPRDEWF